MSEVVEQTKPRQPPLAETQRRLGARVAERDGLTEVTHYGDPASEYEAVRAGAGLFDLSARGRVEVAGGEAVMFLNGLVTNDVKALAQGEWMAAAFPNAQGRLLAQARVARRADSFLIDTEAPTRARVLQSLERFTLAGDFRVKDLSEETAELSVQGPRAAGIVGAVVGAEASGLARGRVFESGWRGASVTLLRATHTGEDGFDLVVDSEHAAELWEALTQAGARPAGGDALEVLRVEAGLPRYGADVSEANVVLEAGQDEAVSFTKGCYVGQEIIARIHWRGHVAKRLAGLLMEDDSREPAARDARVVSAEGREAGRVTSSVFSPRAGRAVALGLVRYDYLTPGTELRVESGGGERAARVVALPFVRGGWHADRAGGEA